MPDDSQLSVLSASDQQVWSDDSTDDSSEDSSVYRPPSPKRQSIKSKTRPKVQKHIQPKAKRQCVANRQKPQQRTQRSKATFSNPQPDIIDLSSLSDTDEKEEGEHEDEEEDSAGSLADFIASELSGDEKESKHDETKRYVIPYDVAKDAVNTTLDFVPYSDCREQAPQQKMQFYDRKGNLLTSNAAADLLKSTCFICPGNGSVIYTNNRDLGLFWCREYDGQICHAPGKVIGWLIDPEDFSVTLHVQWLTRNTVYYDTHEPHATTNADEFFAELCDWVPLHWHRAQLIHVSRVSQESHIMDYITVFREFMGLDTSPLLRHWSCDQMTTTNQRDAVVDIADMLEFYHITAKFIWRSRLGRYIWRTFIANYVDFGNVPNMPLVGMLMSTEKWQTRANVDAETPSCSACKKREVGSTTVCFKQRDENKSGNFGSVCLKRMQYLHSVGAHMRDFRSKVFDASCVHTFVPKLQTLHAAYHACNSKNN